MYKNLSVHIVGLFLLPRHTSLFQRTVLPCESLLCRVYSTGIRITYLEEREKMTFKTNGTPQKWTLSHFPKAKVTSRLIRFCSRFVVLNNCNAGVQVQNYLLAILSLVYLSNPLQRVERLIAINSSQKIRPPQNHYELMAVDFI